MRFPTALLALFPFLHAKAEVPHLDIARLIAAIKLAEHSRIDYVSPSGARGCYQIKKDTWMQYSQRPFEWANEPTYIAQEETLRVAMRHAHWVVEKAIPTLHLRPTPYSFALVFQAGYGNVERLNLTHQNVLNAQRVANLYFDTSW